jgi:DNA-directed RNA polymerase specialized sigma24 family protein
MPVLTNLKHETFAQAIAGGRNATEAYINAGYTCARHKARGHGHRLRTREDIVARIDELTSTPAKARGQVAVQQVSEAVRTGRPTLYRPELCVLVYKMAVHGLTDAQIADFLCVPVDTYHRWKSRHRDFREAIRRGKEYADANVAVALYNRARGYSQPAVKILNSPTGIVRVEYVEHFPPDTNAAKFWLANRHPDKRRNRRDVMVDPPMVQRIMDMEPGGAGCGRPSADRADKPGAG